MATINMGKAVNQLELVLTGNNDGQIGTTNVQLNPTGILDLQPDPNNQFRFVLVRLKSGTVDVNSSALNERNETLQAIDTIIVEPLDSEIPSTELITTFTEIG